MILDSIAMLLEQDHEVRTTRSARAALAQLQSGERFDTIFCDLIMPDMDGMEFHAQLVRTHPEMASRVVFMSGGAANSAARAFLDQISNKTLYKPFNLEGLQRVLAECLGDEPPRRP